MWTGDDTDRAPNATRRARFATCAGVLRTLASQAAWSASSSTSHASARIGYVLEREMLPGPRCGASFAKTLDYNAADDAKGKDIAAKHFKTADEQKQRDVAVKRFEFRDFLGTSYYREVNLKPLP
jgi:hypothetical protein